MTMSGAFSDAEIEEIETGREKEEDVQWLLKLASGGVSSRARERDKEQE